MSRAGRPPDPLAAARRPAIAEMPVGIACSYSDCWQDLQVMRPRLKRTLVRIEAPEGDVILMRANGSDVRIENPDRAERELLGSLDGTHSAEELTGRFGQEEFEEAITQLRSLGLLEDAAQDDLLTATARERFDRQLRYFGDLSRLGGVTASQCQLRLASAKVAILGVGGLGGRVALELACIGIGELCLADGDRVEASNLNRQIQYAEADVGLLKVERMAARLRAFNSATTVTVAAEALESEEQIGKFIAGADLVVDAADWPPHEIERRCNSACYAEGIPYIAMSHFPPVVRVGPLYVPGRTGCFACQEIAYRREYPLYDVAIEQRRARPVPAATLGPACGLTAGFVAAEIMHFLTGLLPPRTLGAGYTLDLRSFELERYEVVPEPECPVCAGMLATPDESSPTEEEAPV